MMDAYILFITFWVSHIFVHSSTLKPKLNKSVLIVGLNPALQRTITVNNLELGGVNRASNAKVGIGGKGQNACVASNCMQSIHKLTLLQFLGKGFEGDAVAAMLASQTDQLLSIRTQGRCRVCVTLLNNEETTEIIEPSEDIQSEEILQLLERVQLEYNQEKVVGVAVMGSMPKPCPPTLYPSIISAVCDDHSKVLLDTVAGLLDSVSVCVEKKSQCVIKLNAKELCSFTGIKSTNKGSDDATSSSTIQEASIAFQRQLESFIQSKQDKSPPLSSSSSSSSSKPSLISIAVTDGPHPAHLVSFQLKSNANYNNLSTFSSLRQWTFQVPALIRPLVSPIGAGDATSAGTLMHWCNEIHNNLETSNSNNNDNISINDAALVYAFRWGLSCGSASCMSASNSFFELNDVKDIFSRIKVTQL